MPAQLLALTDGPSIVLDKPVLLFGRHPECDVQLNSRKVSRRHCCVARVGAVLVVRDLGSMNGVRINGERVAEGRLSAGDELAIGGFRYRVEWDDDEAGDGARLPPGPRRPVPVGEPTYDADSMMLESSDEPVKLGGPRPGHLRPPPARPGG